MIPPVSRQEGHPAAGHLADEHGLARLAIRGVDLHLIAVGEEFVETGTADDPDVRDRSHRRQATFSPEEPAEDGEEAAFSPPEDEEDVEDEEDESDEDPAAGGDGEDDDAGAGAEDPLRLSVR